LLSENVTMMKEVVTLNSKEQKRLLVLNQMTAGRCNGGEAAQVLNLSVRQIRRLTTAYREKGAAGLAHGNRGRKSPKAIDEELKRQVIAFYKGEYADFNITHFSESLGERKRIKLSRSTVRNILMTAGIKSPKKRRPPKHRSRRERYPQEGMLIQIDASPHAWLENRGPRLTLIGAIDDATGKVLFAFFQEQEDSAGYFKLLRGIIKRYGIPLALYHDQHTIFDSPKDETESIEDQLEGKKNLTQFGRLLDELGITSISAKSPQAKGRIERLWETFQDRLISELRLIKAATMDEANMILTKYLPAFNRHFQVVPLQPGTVYRKFSSEFGMNYYFCFKYNRIVGGDNVIKFKSKRLQIIPANGRSSYAHAKIEIHVRLDENLAVFYQGNYLPFIPAPKDAPLQRIIDESQVPLVKPNLNRLPFKPSLNHPWRTPFLTPLK
jgi:transposase